MDNFEGFGDMSDYTTWDVNACVNLACEVARVQSAEDVRLYRMSKNTRLKKSTHEGILAEMSYLEKFFKKGFIGCIIDGDTLIKQLKYSVDRRLENGKKDHRRTIKQDDHGTIKGIY